MRTKARRVAVGHDRVSMRRPTEWAAAQRAFHEAYDAAAAFPRTEVYWRVVRGGRLWWRGGPAPLIPKVLVPLAWVAARLVRGRMLNERPMLAVWDRDAAPGAPAVIVFDVAPVPAASEGHGVLVGELAPNGALCIEHGEDVLWPVYNPLAPSRAVPRR